MSHEEIKQELSKLVDAEVSELLHEDELKETTWGRSHQKPDLSYERVENVNVVRVTKVLSKHLQVGDTFAFLNPNDFQSFPIYKVKRFEDHHCAVYKIN